MENKKRGVKIAYKFKYEYHIYPPYKTDKQYSCEETTHCYGLFTDVESMDMNLQDYELFYDIEKKYCPKVHDRNCKDWGWYLDDDENLSGTKEYHNIQNKELDELNEALSERLGVVFIAAEKDDVISNNFYSILNNGLFVDFERSRIDTMVSIEAEIKKITEQIKDLENQIYNLKHGSWWKYRCAPAVVATLEKIVEEKRININEKIPHLDMYPLEIAETCQNKELYETLLRQGATDSYNDSDTYFHNPLTFNCWYGFFKLFPKPNKRLTRADFSNIAASLYQLSDDEIEALLISEDLQMMYKDLIIDSAFIKEIRWCFGEFCDDEDAINLLRVLVNNKRYKAIDLLKEFLMYISIDHWLFCICIETKNLDALKGLKIEILSCYFDDIDYYFRDIKKYYNEEYLGSEMMAYIKANIIDTSQYHSDEDFF